MKRMLSHTISICIILCGSIFIKPLYAQTPKSKVVTSQDKKSLQGAQNRSLKSVNFTKTNCPSID